MDHDNYLTEADFFDSPAIYQIRVWGRLDESWSDRLAGMHITVSQMENHPPITKLTGTLIDQATLSGILNRLYDLGLPLISVMRMTEEG